MPMAKLREQLDRVWSSVDDLVLVHDEGHPRSHWKLGKVEQILTSNDGQNRGAVVRVQAKKSKRTSLLRRPLQLLYPLEVSCAASETAQPEPVLEPREQSAVCLVLCCSRSNTLSYFGTSAFPFQISRVIGLCDSFHYYIS